MGNNGKSILSGGVKQAVEETEPNSTINGTVNIQSLLDSHIYYTGQVSGQLYEWIKAGAIVEVDERDVPELLKRRLGAKTCCGGGTNSIFQLAQ